MISPDLVEKVAQAVAKADAADKTLAFLKANLALTVAKFTVASDDFEGIKASLQHAQEGLAQALHAQASFRTTLEVILDIIDRELPLPKMPKPKR